MINIYWNKRKNKLSIEKVKEMLKKNNIDIINAPYEFANKLISEYDNYIWTVYIGEDDEAPFSRDDFIMYREYLRDKIKDAKEIYMERNIKVGDGYPFAYVIFRKKEGVN